MSVISPFQTNERVVILGVTAGDDDSQSLQVVVNETQDIVKALTGISDDLTNGEVGKATLQVLEAGDGLQVVVSIGGNEGAGDGPIGKEPIIYDVKALRLVAKMVLASP